MHPFAKRSFEFFKSSYVIKKKNPKILDLGSMDINGTIKNQIDFESKYIGVDLEPGKNVDVVLENPYKLPFEDNNFDFVISISTFEHIEFFWESFIEILRVLKSDGLFFLNAPASGHFHRHRTDNWRFYPDAGSSLVNWGKKKGFNPELLESFIHNYSGREGTNDFVAVFIKDEKYKNKYNDRILNSFKDFRNGKIDNNKNILNFKKLMQDQDNWGWKLYYKLNKFFDKVNKKILRR